MGELKSIRSLVEQVVLNDAKQDSAIQTIEKARAAGRESGGKWGVAAAVVFEVAVRYAKFRGWIP